NGKVTKIYSGEIHYPRVPHEYWKDRLLKIKATGFNTISTYAFWNVHEPKPGVWNFSGDNNIAGFIRTANEVGLNVILRPGPYVCAEWDFGGLPAWLLKEPGMKIRCNDPAFMKAAEKYLMRLGTELKGLQINAGGPIIMVQLENEYGAYGNDTRYLTALKLLLKKAGFTVPLFSADNPEDKMYINSQLPDVKHVVNFGEIYHMLPDTAFGILSKHQTYFPEMCGEYWTGWFTTWSDKKFATPNFDIQKRDIEWMLKTGKSFNCYMIHGGTNFGFMAGANNWGNRYMPYITSYDYESPISEGGIPTERAFAIRDVIKQYATWSIPDYPSPKSVIEIPPIKMEETASLWDNLPTAIFSVQPKSMENYGQNFGYILYRTTLTGTRSGLMKVKELHDYATVFINGKLIGTLDRMKNIDTIRIPDVTGKTVILDILVHALGRNNYGDRMLEERKGITENVSFEPFTQMNWQVFPLPMDSKYLQKLKFVPKTELIKAGGFYRGNFILNDVGDTYLDLKDYKNGFVVINGHNLGRFWDKGPQQRLYCPAPWLKKGVNEVIVFDMEGVNIHEVKGYITAN
ncbi:beta-galactosidase, partial [Ferruginibacter sp.]|uniref:beta-galactosidase n=1 Tax=Ferruginibacter sp. TaxID=1940288 RepID=UPI0019953D25